MKDIQYPFSMKTQQLSEERCIAYADEGKGNEVILFVHGLGSYAPAWIKNVESLKTSFRCIVVDLPGYGKSCKGKYEGSMTFYAQILVEFMDSLGLRNVHFAGHSMGGQISITTALLYPNRVSSLILVAPAGFERFDEGEKQWFREVVTPRGTKFTTPQQIQANLTSNFYKYPKDADFMISDRIAIRNAMDFDWYCYIVSQSVQGMVNQPVVDKLQNIKHPVLIFFGAQDNLIPNRFLNAGKTKHIAEYGASQIKNSKLIIAEKCGHFAQYEKANLFNTEVITFLNNLK
jgi:pimeloyl-ACP methyl ester carboxylesterase